MFSFEKGISSTNDPSFSGETKENAINHDKMGFNSKSQNPKKPLTKHFMSPTISAISKVTVPRKKILVEKNESLTSYDNTLVQKSPIHEYSGSKGTCKCDIGSKNHAISACNCISEADDDEPNNTSFADGSLKPYDPLTNYLSPRPKYLRYKPNRRHEILQRSGVFYSQNSTIVDDERSSGSGCDQEETFVPPQVIMVDGEDSHNYGQDANDDEEEEEESEEVEAAKSWSLKGLVKFLVVLIVLGLSTSYISSMNSPSPSPVVQAIEGLTEGYNRIQKHLFEVVYTNLQHGGTWRNGSGVEPGDGKTGFLGFNWNGDHEFGRFQIEVDDEEEMEERTDDIIEMPEPPNREFDDIYEGDEGDKGLNRPDWKISENKDINDEMKKIEQKCDQLKVCETAQTDGTTDQELDKVEEEGSEGLQQCASLEKTECFSKRTDDTEIDSGNEPANLICKGGDRLERSIGEKAGEEMAWTKLARAEDDAITSREDESCNKGEAVEEISLEKVGEEMDDTKMQISENENFLPAKMENDDIQPDASVFELYLKSMKDLKLMELGPIVVAAILFSMFSLVLASLVYIYSPKAAQDSQLELFDRKEKWIEAKPFAQVEHTEERVVDSIVKPSSVSFSFEEAAKHHRYIRGPEVELLGEFVIGEFSSSLRSCDWKGRTNETEESINPVAQAETLNVSRSDSPSYGSFTAEKIMFKKEGGGRDGNVKVVTTPVRRSGRIRNLSVTSP
ncbi:hypothetical protein ACH5RR_008002 [Cinchona calisaya]|uniref:Transmembrane protein n=1 Tax=Cinchona calisaya TaxID=153742 RepID=A0ABD3AA49_9GENT